MSLHTLGWNQFFEGQFHAWADQGYVPARVAEEHRTRYIVIGEFGVLPAEVSGRFRHLAESSGGFPAVGDWVVAAPTVEKDRCIIHGLLERKSGFSRKAASSGGMPDTGGRTDEQVLAANIDTVFLVSGLDGDFNPRRVERYLVAAWDSGAAPVILLNKADLCEDVEVYLEAIREVAFGVSVLVISAQENRGLEALEPYLSSTQTTVFLGSSGVGKSTIINRLLGEDRIKTHEVREYDSRGRHTTTFRQMLFLPGGGIVIDTPGLRELQLWDDGGLSRTFADIEELVGQCRFTDCRHETEPGCAVREAIKDGRLSEDRYRRYLKLQKENRFLAMRKDQAAQRRAVREWDRRIRQYNQAKKDLKKRGLL
jgi:ribosome biogenesis GTPase